MEILLLGFFTGLSLILAIGAQNIFVIEQGLKKQHIFLVCLICSLSDLILIFLGIFLFHYFIQYFNSTIELIFNILLIIFLLHFIYSKIKVYNSSINFNTDTKNISKLNLGAVTDVTDQFVMINLKGNKIYELFQAGSPFNFNDFQNKKGAVTQTILTKIDVIIHNQDKSAVNMFVRRSFSQHLFSWMNDAASRL